MNLKELCEVLSGEIIRISVKEPKKDPVVVYEGCYESVPYLVIKENGRLPVVSVRARYENMAMFCGDVPFLDILVEWNPWSKEEEE